MATMAGGSKPLMLKDLLELDCESCSAAGFRCYPRRLCVAGAAVATTTASSPMQRPKLSSLSKSLSRRLRGGFWRRREDEDEAASPAGSNAPTVSSCCSSSDSETSDSSNSTGRKSHSRSESEFSSASSDSLHAGEPSTTGAEHEGMKRESKEEADDKEQLSPVGVMDFPFDEEEEDDAAAVEEEEDGPVAAGACSFSFSDSLAQLQLQRRKMKLQPKIRRLESMGELVVTNLEARFAALECDGFADVAPAQLPCSTDVAAPPPRRDDHRSVGGVFEKDPDEHSVLDTLVDTVSVGVVDDVTKRLLLDLSIEARRNIELRTLTSLSHESRRRENGETLRLAKAWLEGTGTRWSLNDVLCHGEDVMAEMERGRRWMHTGEEVRETGVVVAAMVIDELLHELVSDLVA